MRGGVTTRLVDQPEQKTQGGSVIAERAGLIELTCSGEKLGLRGCESAYTQSRTQRIFGRNELANKKNTMDLVFFFVLITIDSVLFHSKLKKILQMN